MLVIGKSPVNDIKLLENLRLKLLSHTDIQSTALTNLPKSIKSELLKHLTTIQLDINQGETRISVRKDEKSQHSLDIILNNEEYKAIIIFLATFGMLITLQNDLSKMIEETNQKGN